MPEKLGLILTGDFKSSVIGIYEIDKITLAKHIVRKLITSYDSIHHELGFNQYLGFWTLFTVGHIYSKIGKTSQSCFFEVNYI